MLASLHELLQISRAEILWCLFCMACHDGYSPEINCWYRNTCQELSTQDAKLSLNA